MASPPTAKKSRPAAVNTIRMKIFDEGMRRRYPHTQAVRLHGFPWHIFHTVVRGRDVVALECGKSNESALWWCTPTLTLIVTQSDGTTVILPPVKHKFTSWNPSRFDWHEPSDTIEVLVKIECDIDGDSFRLLPPNAPWDGCLVVDGEIFRVNKKSLADQSSFFFSLFYVEKNPAEIEIKEVDPKDFAKLLLMAGDRDTYQDPDTKRFSSSGRLINCENAEKWLQLAERFDLKIAKDRVVNTLLRRKNIPTYRKLQLSEQFRLETLKFQLSKSDLVSLANSPECALLSPDLMLQMFRQLAAAPGATSGVPIEACGERSEGQGASLNTIVMKILHEGRRRIYPYTDAIRISGFPWRVFYSVDRRTTVSNVALLCDKSRESPLWSCAPTLTASLTQSDGTTISLPPVKHEFASWKAGPRIDWKEPATEQTVEVMVKIECDIDGDSFRCLPERGSVSDCCLVVEGEKFSVNKQLLAAQSSFFASLFFGEYMEKNLDEIEIKEVDPKDFAQLLAMVSGEFTYYDPDERRSYDIRALINGESAEKWLQLAERFDLKIVEDRVVNYLLRHACMPVYGKLQLAEQFRLETLKLRLPTSNLIALANSPDCALLSPDLMLQMFRQLAAACEE